VSIDRVAILRDDIEAGPTALTALVDAYAAPDGPLAAIDARPSEVGFVGLGSSRYAAAAAAAGAWHGGLPAWAEYASASALPALGPDGALVAISASGRTREVVGAAHREQGRRRVIAVTNDPASVLVTEADAVLPLFAGAEGAGIATRTFRGTIAVLALLVGRWTDGAGGATVDALARTTAALRAVMDGRDAWLPAATELFDCATAIDVLADATDMALAQQAALMLREAPRLAAVAHDTADWLHTAVYLALPGHRALLYVGSAADAEVVATIRRRGGETVVVGSPIEGATLTIAAPPLDGPFERAIALSVVAELISLELWARTSAEELAER
jgi:fructoselysine-6-P-deglycase FrlB-like protein